LNRAGTKSEDIFIY